MTSDPHHLSKEFKSGMQFEIYCFSTVVANTLSYDTRLNLLMFLLYLLLGIVEISVDVEPTDSRLSLEKTEYGVLEPSDTVDTSA